MKNSFVTGLALGVIASVAIAEADINYKAIYKKGKRMIKKKIESVMD